MGNFYFENGSTGPVAKLYKLGSGLNLVYRLINCGQTWKNQYTTINAIYRLVHRYIIIYNEVHSYKTIKLTVYLLDLKSLKSM